MKKKWIPILLASLILAVIVAVGALYFLYPEQFRNTWNKVFYHDTEELLKGVSFEPVMLEMSGETDKSKLADVKMQQTARNDLETAEDELNLKIQSYADGLMETIFEAEGVYITDKKGNVLFSRNPHEELYPASTTKLLTALVVMDHTEDLDDEVTIQPLEGCYESGSVLLWLEEGDRMTVRDLLHAMLMVSYNDAATALAMEVGGSLESFADMMNEKAEEIGCVDSHFVTPHGLFDQDHYTSAYDMNLIMRAAMDNEVIRQILSEESYEFVLHGQSGADYPMEIESSNYFLNEDYVIPGFHYLGGKTGYIFAARSCLCSAFRDVKGEEIYCAVLKALDASYMTCMAVEYVFDPLALITLSEQEPYMKEWQLEYESE